MKKEHKAVAGAIKAGAVIMIAMGLFLSGCDKKDAAGQNAGKAGSSAAQESGAKADPAQSKGVGPIKSLSLAAVDAALAAKGDKVFSGTCSACHKMDQRYVGPALAGVTKRRTPEWIMNMIMNPAEMTQKDETAKALLGEYMTQMSVNATEDEARALLEYFRKLDGQ
jgi:mono/diheme cytochrome c family protein